MKTYHIKTIEDIKALRSDYDDYDVFTEKFTDERLTIPEMLFLYDGQELIISDTY